MSNRISYCIYCNKKEVKSIYFRHENRSFRVAFSICENCGGFFNFHDWKNKRRTMPFYDDMKGLLRGKLVKGENRSKVYLMRKDPNVRCIRGRNHEYSKLYVKDERQTPHFVGYLCKECRIAYFVRTEFLKLKPDESGDLGGYSVSVDYEDPEQEIIVKSYSVTPKDGKKIDGVIKKLGIKLQRM